MSELRPRHYAAAYFAAGSDKEKQRTALAGCPDELKAIVRTHIKNRTEIERAKR